MPTNRKKKVSARREKTGESYQSALRNVRAADGGDTVTMPDWLSHDLIDTEAAYASYDVASGAYVDAYGQVVAFDGRAPIRVPFIKRPDPQEFRRLILAALHRVASRCSVSGEPETLVRMAVKDALMKHRFADLHTDRFLVNPLDLDVYRREVDNVPGGSALHVEGEVTIPQGETLALCGPRTLGVVGEQRDTREVAILVHANQGVIHLVTKAGEDKKPPSLKPGLHVFYGLVPMTIAIQIYLRETGGTTVTYDCEPQRRTMGFRVGEVRFHVPLTSLKELSRIPPILEPIWSGLKPTFPDEPMEARWGRVGAALVASTHRISTATPMPLTSIPEQPIPGEDVDSFRELLNVARQDPHYSVVVNRPTEKKPPSTHENLALDLKDRITSMWKSPEIVVLERRVYDMAVLIEGAVNRLNKLIEAHEFQALSWKSDDTSVALCVQLAGTAIPEGLRRNRDAYESRENILTLTFTIVDSAFEVLGADKWVVRVSLHLDLIQSDAGTWKEPYGTFDAARVDNILTMAFNRAIQNIPTGPKPL